MQTFTLLKKFRMRKNCFVLDCTLSMAMFSVMPGRRGNRYQAMTSGLYIFKKLCPAYFFMQTHWYLGKVFTSLLQKISSPHLPDRDLVAHSSCLLEQCKKHLQDINCMPPNDVCVDFAVDSCFIYHIALGFQRGKRKYFILTLLL